MEITETLTPYGPGESGDGPAASCERERTPSFGYAREVPRKTDLTRRNGSPGTPTRSRPRIGGSNYGSLMEAPARSIGAGATIAWRGIARGACRSRPSTHIDQRLHMPRNEGVPGSSPGIGSNESLGRGGVGRQRTPGRGTRKPAALLRGPVPGQAWLLDSQTLAPSQDGFQRTILRTNQTRPTSSITTPTTMMMPTVVLIPRADL